MKVIERPIGVKNMKLDFWATWIENMDQFDNVCETHIGYTLIPVRTWHDPDTFEQLVCFMIRMPNTIGPEMYIIPFKLFKKVYSDYKLYNDLVINSRATAKK